MTKRICVIRQSIYPLELSVRRETETLHNNGYETHIICLEPINHQDNKMGKEVIDGVIVHRIRLQRKKASKARYIIDYTLFTLLAAIKLLILHFRHPFDLIQVNTMPDFLVFATLIPKLFGTKVVVMMQEPVPELWQTLYNSPPPRLITMMEQWALAYSDGVFTVTNELKDTYVDRGADEEKISVILNVPETRFLNIQNDDHPPPRLKSGFSLICHGAIEERYGHDTILDAIAILSEQIPDLRLKILGRGRYVEDFLKKRDELQLDGIVDYLGWVSLRELIHHLHSADVGIVAQKSSPYSNLVHTNKMYEYIAIGKPVLASRLKSVAAYFGDEAIRYFEPGDADSLAEGIIDLYHNPLKCQSLVNNAQSLFEEYRWEKQQEKYLAVFRELIG
jgi:glycosyltransferase involved in cell wall biosynthesis